MRQTLAILVRSFLKGLIILGPIAITAYFIWWIFSAVDSILPIPNMYPGIGVAIIICSVMLVGYLGSRSFLGKSVVEFTDHMLERIPGIKHIYSPIKDVMGSFVGDKKRFNQAVYVKVHNDPETWRIGFLTQPDMEYLGKVGKVAVYLPHSYAISGWVIVTDSSNVEPVTAMSAAEAMKFAVSGGVAVNETEANSPAITVLDGKIEALK